MRSKYRATPKIGLMMVGVALIGTWAGIAASWFMAAADERQHDNIHTLRVEIQELRAMLEGRSQQDVAAQRVEA
jgi:hypothetical protein